MEITQNNTMTHLLPQHQGRCPRGQRFGPHNAEARQRRANEAPTTARRLWGDVIEAFLRRWGGKICPEMTTEKDSNYNIYISLSVFILKNI